MTDDVKLKPCPFCGSESMHYVTAWGIKCTHCGAGAPCRFDDIESVWNTRTDTITPAMAANVLLEATPLCSEAVDAAHQQIDWCRDGQNTYEASHPSQSDGGSTCAEDIQDAWAAALRAIAEQEE